MRERPEHLSEDAWKVWLSFYGELPLEAPFGAVYPRVSSPGQEEGWSLISQLKAELERAKEDGVTILPEHVYWEVHTGEDLWERPALTRLRAAMKTPSRPFDVIYFYAVDRFAREPFYVDLVMDEAKRASVEVRFIMQSFDDTAEGQLLRGIAGYVAKKELYAIKERTNRGKRERVIENGKPYGAGKPPYGYVWSEPLSDSRRDRHCFCEPDIATAHVVKRIYAEVAAGRGLRAICADLMRDGILTPLGKRTWKTGTLSNILDNDAYAGRSFANRWVVTKKNGKRHTKPRPREEWVPLKDGVYPPLVSEEMWESAQTVRHTNKALAARNNRTPEGFLLRGGFARCGVPACRGSMIARRYKSGYTIYVCHGNVQGAHPPGGVTRPSANSKDLDDAVWAHVSRMMDEEGFLDAELRRLAESDHIGLDLKAIDARLADIDAQLANYTQGMATAKPAVVALISDQMNKLSEQRTALEAERGGVERRGSTVARARDHVEQLRQRLGPQLSRALENLSYLERRRTLIALGIRVTVDNRHQPGKWGLPPYVIEAALPHERVDSDTSGLTLMSQSTRNISVAWRFGGGRAA
jgi:DNA invertase Pin-like site-specific DNA recombinase